MSDEMWPGASTLRWDDDEIAREIVRDFGPLTGKEVAAILGFSPAHIHRIEQAALRKLGLLAGDDRFDSSSPFGSDVSSLVEDIDREFLP